MKFIVEVSKGSRLLQLKGSINNISACHDNIFKEIDVYDPANAMIPA